jgi:hypothetical protein
VLAPLGVALIGTPATPAIPHSNVADHPLPGTLAQKQAQLFRLSSPLCKWHSAVRGKWLSHYAASSAVFFSVFGRSTRLPSAGWHRSPSQQWAKPEPKHVEYGGNCWRPRQSGQIMWLDPENRRAKALHESLPGRQINDDARYLFGIGSTDVRYSLKPT